MGVNVEEYYRKYGPMVLRRCRFLLKNEDMALDAMQDVFVRLLMSQERLRDEYPSSLLYRMATNVCINVIRSEGRKSAIGDDAVLNGIAFYDHLEERTAARSILDRIFRNEKESTREMAVMHYVDGMKLEDISAEVGLSVSGIRKRLRNLKSRVKKIEGIEL
ncbi:MAG: RNA polymerase sigma factor [Spirochaetes bacterium]|jgi:RNA polymerase sigma-70 factor (ECF subfamily)|nr:RNA polymerase sigma factor [Spirochaetota bacterium]